MEPIAVPILLLGPDTSDRSGAFTTDAAVGVKEADKWNSRLLPRCDAALELVPPLACFLLLLLAARFARRMSDDDVQLPDVQG